MKIKHLCNHHLEDRLRNSPQKFFDYFPFLQKWSFQRNWPTPMPVCPRFHVAVLHLLIMLQFRMTLAKLSSFFTKPHPQITPPPLWKLANYMGSIICSHPKQCIFMWQIIQNYHTFLLVLWFPPQNHSTFHDLFFKRRGQSAQNARLK